MYLNNLVTPATIGKRKRLHRILGSAGKCVIVPIDDSLISFDNKGLTDLLPKINNIIDANPNGVLCYYGAASLISRLDIPLIINISASTIQSSHTRKVLISSVQQALAIDAAAVAVHINISSRFEGEMLRNLGIVSETCNTYGMPLLVITYPRKELASGDENYYSLKEANIEEYTRLVSHCVRVAFELGADIIKTQYTGDTESFSKVVLAASGKPVVIAGGKLCDENHMYEMVLNAMQAGAAGISIGRNIFNRENSYEVIKNLQKIVFETNEKITEVVSW